LEERIWDGLSIAVGEALGANGIVLEVDKKTILFRCPKGEFVAWKSKKNL
jgi:hypothetical protein